MGLRILAAIGGAIGGAFVGGLVGIAIAWAVMELGPDRSGGILVIFTLPLGVLFGATKGIQVAWRMAAPPISDDQ